MSAISAPRIARISALLGSSFVRSTTSPGPPLAAGRRNRISPSTIRPGRSTILRMDRAVTLLPHPLSPTIPSVAPGVTSKLTPSTAFTNPSSCAKYVFKFLTERSGSAITLAASSAESPVSIAASSAGVARAILFERRLCRRNPALGGGTEEHAVRRATRVGGRGKHPYELHREPPRRAAN